MSTSTTEEQRESFGGCKGKSRHKDVLEILSQGQDERESNVFHESIACLFLILPS